MGDRAMVEIKTGDGSFYVYTHWGGSDLPQTVVEAVRAAKGRWGDDSYCARIIVDQITKPNRDQETGAGILLKPDLEDEYNNDNPSVVIDILEKKIHVKGSHESPYFGETAFESLT